jgi:hypothetical protein
VTTYNGLEGNEQGVERVNFKQGAIYQLPNGRELVLFNLNASVPGRYHLNAEGRLLLHGELTAWETRDLYETGRVASPDLTAILAAASLGDKC